jgi:hypothetical protein
MGENEARERQIAAGSHARSRRSARLSRCMDTSTPDQQGRGCSCQGEGTAGAIDVECAEGVGGSAVEAGAFVPGGEHVHVQSERPLTATGGSGIVAR